jgi:ribosomal protein L13
MWVQVTLVVLAAVSFLGRLAFVMAKRLRKN